MHPGSLLVSSTAQLDATGHVVAVSCGMCLKRIMDTDMKSRDEGVCCIGACGLLTSMPCLKHRAWSTAMHVSC